MQAISHICAKRKTKNPASVPLLKETLTTWFKLTRPAEFEAFTKSVGSDLTQMRNFLTLEDSKEEPLIIGIDLGGVVFPGGDRYNPENTEPVFLEGCIQALRELKRQGHILVVVSYCRNARAKRTFGMLQSSELYRDLFDLVFFVGKRQHKKHLVNMLQMDVMIDDTPSILAGMPDNTECILFGNKESTVDGVHRCENWASVSAHLARVTPTKAGRPFKLENVDYAMTVTGFATWL